MNYNAAPDLYIQRETTNSKDEEAVKKRNEN